MASGCWHLSELLLGEALEKKSEERMHCVGCGLLNLEVLIVARLCLIFTAFHCTCASQVFLYGCGLSEWTLTRRLRAQRLVGYADPRY